MAKKSMIVNAQDTVIDAAKASVDGVTTLAGDTLNAVAKAATGAVLEGVKQARRLVSTDKPKRKKAAKKTAKKVAAKKTVKKAVKTVKKAKKKVAVKAKAVVKKTKSKVKAKRAAKRRGR